MRAAKVLLVLVAFFWMTAGGARADAIHDAVRAGDMVKLKAIVAASPELIDAKGEDGDTPLHIAAIVGGMEAALFLVGRGANVDSRNSANQSPLLYAAYAGHAALADTLIARGAKIDDADTRGSAPIHYAARLGRAEVVKVLLSRGAAFDRRGNAGRTPLYLAAANGRSPVVRLLAAQGARLDTRDDAGETPLSAALAGGYAETAEFLLDAGLPIEGDARALERFIHLAAAAGSQEIVDALAAKGASLDGADSDGRTLLHQAAIGGLPDLARTMIERLGTVDAADSLGRTALHWAAGANREEIARLLLEKGADPNIPDRNGRTPLHIAGDSGWPEMERLLRARGARDLERRIYRLARTASSGRAEAPENLPLDVVYVGNEGFLLERGGKKVLIDALQRIPMAYSGTGERVFAMMLDGTPPFDGIDLSIVSHPHTDHMSARMNLDLLERNAGVAFVSSPEACDSMRAVAGAGFGAIAKRVVVVDPPWKEVAKIRVNGVDLEFVGVNHAPEGAPYKTLATIVDFDGIRIAHLADEISAVNLENYRAVDLARGGIDIVFADQMMLQDSIGQHILRELIKPRYIILMHAQEGELDAAERDLVPLHPNLLIFREQLERRRFAF